MNEGTMNVSHPGQGFQGRRSMASNDQITRPMNHFGTHSPLKATHSEQHGVSAPQITTNGTGQQVNPQYLQYQRAYLKQPNTTGTMQQPQTHQEHIRQPIHEQKNPQIQEQQTHSVPQPMKVVEDHPPTLHPVVHATMQAPSQEKEMVLNLQGEISKVFFSFFSYLNLSVDPRNEVLSRCSRKRKER
jgi:hypothetical protein